MTAPGTAFPRMDLRMPSTTPNSVFLRAQITPRQVEIIWLSQRTPCQTPFSIPLQPE